ncbi:MAG: hypothetical protein ACLRIS_03415 [Flavonifractor plautii]
MAEIDRWALERACWARGSPWCAAVTRRGRARWPARSTPGRSFCPRVLH